MKQFCTILLTILSLASGKAQIVYSDYSDPDICQGTQGDYWLTASSFQCTPGLPILHSTDLTHWTLANYAVHSLHPLNHYNTIQHGNGIWAPSIRFHNNTYYIYWGDPDFGVFMVKTTNPEGKWDEPVLVCEGKGIIDTCPLWDDDGRCYLVNGWAKSRCGFNSILTIRELNCEGTKAITPPTLIYDGLKNGDHTIEGPKLYKKDGWYYILAPAGSVATGWQVALRSKSIYGPYERKTVFNKDGIHQGGMVAVKSSREQDSDYAFICFQEVGAYGRILHLLDIDWKDGWPMMKLSKENYTHTDNSKSPITYTTQGSPYQWHSNYQDHYGFVSPTGTRVYSHKVSENFRNMWEVPNLYLRKFDGRTFSDTLHLTITSPSPATQSGFIIMGRDYCRLSVQYQADQFILSQIVCKNADNGAAEQVDSIAQLPVSITKNGASSLMTTHLHIIINCKENGLCDLYYSTDNHHFTPLSPFQAREGRWIGAKYGIYSITSSDSPKGWIDMAD